MPPCKHILSMENVMEVSMMEEQTETRINTKDN
uniref:Uncharacterized protein n=1 Tax=Anguilla anguilla TaxID=7936 RepID=A0A0E9XC37_ANGAN